jgi:hypothetical protein
LRAREKTIKERLDDVTDRLAVDFALGSAAVEWDDVVCGWLPCFELVDV